MTAHPFAYRRLPADTWTAEHDAVAETLTHHGIDPIGAEPGWIVTYVLVEDHLGQAGGIATLREAALTNCPPDPDRLHALTPDEQGDLHG